MALSNWDTMAVDEKGAPTNGVFVSPKGVRVEIYKNWLYLSEKSAEDESLNPRGIVGTVQSGEMSLKDVHIFAKRGPQNGIYCIVYWSNFEPVPKEGCELCGVKPAEDGKKDAYHERACPKVFGAMLGIGCYGYSDSEFVGVLPKSVEFLRAWQQESVTEKHRYGQTSIEPGKKPKTTYTTRTVTSNTFEDYIRNIPLGGGQRFNQGNAFFANALGDEGLLAPTEPGKATPTVAERLMGDPGSKTKGTKKKQAKKAKKR